MMEAFIPDLSFSMIPSGSVIGTARYGEKVTIFDNIHTDRDIDPGQLPDYFRNYPLKMQFSVLTYCGRGSICIDAGLRRTTLQPGDFAIIPVGMIISDFRMSDDCRLIAVNHNTLENSVLEMPELTRALVGTFTTGMTNARISEPLRNLFISGCDRLRELMELEGFMLRNQAVDGEMRVLMAILIESMKRVDNVDGADTRPHQLVSKFAELVAIHYRRERGVRFYAEKLCVTPKYLGQIVKRLSGKNPLSMISEYVILEAKVLLKMRGTSIKQVSTELNFPNQSFFTKYFRKYSGMTPQEYRNS